MAGLIFLSEPDEACLILFELGLSHIEAVSFEALIELLLFSSQREAVNTILLLQSETGETLLETVTLGSKLGKQFCIASRLPYLLLDFFLKRNEESFELFDEAIAYAVRHVEELRKGRFDGA